MASERKRIWVGSDGKERKAFVVDYRDLDGKRRLKTFRTQKAAKKYHAKVQVDLDAGIHIADSASATLEEAFELWQKRGAIDKLRRSTIEQREMHWRVHIKPFLGTAKKLSQLTTPRIYAFVDKLAEEGRSPAMCAKVLTSLKSIITEAQRRGLVAQNVASPVKVNRDDNKEPAQIPDRGEVAAILSAAKDSGNRYAPILKLLAFTGLRVSEAQGLTWAAVDLDGQMLEVRQRADRWGDMAAPKTKTSRRKVPLAVPALAAFREQRIASPPKDDDDLVFRTRSGKPWGYTNILNRGMKAAQIKAGVVDKDGKPKYAIHSLRHFYASLLIAQGAQPKRVQTLLGHATIGITMDTYTHLWPSQEDDLAMINAAALTVVAGTAA